MLPYEIIYGMRIIIEKKNFSTPLTLFKFKKENNTFYGTDSYCLLEYTPSEIVPVPDDFYLTRHQVRALEAIITPQQSITIRGAHSTNSKLSLIEFAWEWCSLCLPNKSQVKPEDYPTIQTSLFGETASMDHMMTNGSMQKFVNVGKKINPIGIAEARERCLVMEHTDTFWGKVRLSVRNSSPKEKDQDTE